MSINLTVVIDNEEAVRKFRELQKTAKTVTSSVVTDADRMDIAMRRIATTLGQIGVAVSLTGLIRQIALTRGEFQQLEVAFTTLLGNKEKADALMAEMVDLAAKTPLDLQGVASGARQLLAYGFAAKEITDTLTRLGNVAAGLGLPLERLTYLYGTTAVQGRLYARDMLQFTSSGIPVLQELANMYGKTTEEINKMVSDGKIGFEDVRKVIENMTNEGGKFYNLMQEQSKTITGLISNLGDALDTMFNDIGKSQEGVISDVLKGTISLVKNYQKVLDILIPIVATYGAYKTALIVTAALQKAAVTASSIKAFFDLAKGINAAKDAQLLFNMAFKANPLGLALSVLTLLGTAAYKYANGAYRAADAQKLLSDNMAEAASSAAIEQSELARLKGKLQACKEGAEEYDRVKNEIIKKFGKYDEGLKAETLNVDTLAQKYNSLTEAIMRSYNARQYDKFSQEQTATFDETATENYNKIFKVLTQKYGEELGTQYGVELQKAISGGIVRVVQNSGGILRISGLENFKSTIGGALGLTNQYEVYSGKVAGFIANIVEAQDELRKTDELARKRFGIEGVVSTTTNEAETSAIVSLSDTIAAAREKLARLKSELADLRADKLPKSAKTDFDWAKAIKEKQKAIKEQEEELNTLIGYDPKQAKKTTDAQKKLNEQVIANDQALLESRIALMKDGKAKELAEIDARTKAKLDAIDKERKEEEDRAKKVGVKLSTGREAIFTERERNAQTERLNSRADIELKYAKELDSIYKQITEDTLSEEDRRIRSIKDKYQEFREWVEKALKGGSINLGQAFDFGVKIDQAEIAASLKAIVDEYGSAEDKIAKIREKAANARKVAAESERMDLIPRIDKREREEIGEVKAEELMKTDDWINLFQNLDALSSKEIRRIIDNINEQLKNANLDPINLKAVTDQLQQATDVAAKKNPFAAVVNGFKDYKAAQQKAITLQKKYERTQDEIDKKAADQAAIEAIGKKQEAWEGVSDVLDIINSTLNEIASVASSFGANDNITSAINSISGIAGGTVQAVSGFASGNIIGGIQGAFSAIASIGKLFNYDDQLQDEIDRLQRRIDQLQWEVDNSDVVRLYTNTEKSIARIKRLYAETTQEVLRLHGATKGWTSILGRAFYGDEIREKTADKLAKAYASVEYSANKALGSAKFSDAKGQLTNLAQQQLLIQEQINKEEDKKKTDRGKVEDWKRQIEELGNEAVEVINQLVESIIGGSAAEIASELGNAFFDAFAAGEDAAEAWGNKVDDIVANIVRQMLVSKFLEEPLGDIFDEYKKRWFGDGTFDEKTIMDQIIASMGDFKSDLNDLGDLFQNIIEALPDDILDNLIPEGSTSGQTATSRGFQAMSQDTGDELNGRFTDMQGKMNILVSGMDMLRSINMETRNTSIDIRDIMIQLNGNVADIRTFTKVLPEMSSTLTSMNRKLDNL
jgi:tape measure domain-containing protein